MTDINPNSTPASPLKLLTIVGFLEGCSFLLLLGVAMPLKYYFDNSSWVPPVGMAHGILFLAYLVVLMGTAHKVKMPVWAMPAGVLAALLPFGPFIFDAALKRSVRKNEVLKKPLQ